MPSNYGLISGLSLLEPPDLNFIFFDETSENKLEINFKNGIVLQTSWT